MTSKIIEKKSIKNLKKIKKIFQKHLQFVQFYGIIDKIKLIMGENGLFVL